MNPSPVYPNWQIQLKLPTVLLQFASSLHPPLFVAHSSISALSQINRCNKNNVVLTLQILYMIGRTLAATVVRDMWKFRKYRHAVSNVWRMLSSDYFIPFLLGNSSGKKHFHFHANLYSHSKFDTGHLILACNSMKYNAEIWWRAYSCTSWGKLWRHVYLCY